MNNKDEIHALDRLMYMLEERSFEQLKMSDKSFATFVESLYVQISRQVDRIEQRHAA